MALHIGETHHFDEDPLSQFCGHRYLVCVCNYRAAGKCAKNALSGSGVPSAGSPRRHWCISLSA
jgi:hypothetical protein